MNGGMDGRGIIINLKVPSLSMNEQTSSQRGVGRSGGRLNENTTKAHQPRKKRGRKSNQLPIPITKTSSQTQEHIPLLRSITSTSSPSSSSSSSSSSLSSYPHRHVQRISRSSASNRIESDRINEIKIQHLQRRGIVFLLLLFLGLHRLNRQISRSIFETM